MNTVLKELLDSGDVKEVRTLHYTIKGQPVAFTTQYLMNSALGPMKWYCTWLDPECPDKELGKSCSIHIHMARARLYFPAYLDTRIPPANREEPQLSEILHRYGLTEYDKFNLIAATHADCPIKPGRVDEIEPRHCPYDDIHAIEEIMAEYKRTL